MTARDNEPYNENNDGMRQNGLGFVRLESRHNSAFVVVACNDKPVIKCENATFG